MRYRALLLAGAAGLLSIGPVGPALAQTAAPQAGNTITEVVVTARKRQESLQKIPVAITAETGAQLAQLHVTQPTDLNRLVPSLLISQSSSSDTSTQIQLRAQSSADSLLGLSQPVGLYEDSVNIPHPKGSNNGLLDIQRVEVLNGPQGTLYGRNTTGGAVNIITNGANFNGFHGFVEGEIGNFNDYRGAFAVNVPILPDVLAVRLAYQHWSQQGFGRSIYSGQHFGNDHDDDLARLSIKFDPTPTIDVVGKLEYGRQNHTGPMISPYSAPSGSDPLGLATQQRYDAIALYSIDPTKYNTLYAAGDYPGIIAAGATLMAPCIGHLYVNCSTIHQFERTTSWHGVLDAKWNITDNVMIRSITGVHFFTDTTAADLAGLPGLQSTIGMGIGGVQSDVGAKLPVPIRPDQQSTQWTQEINLSGKYFDDKLDWLVGAFGSWDKGFGSQQYGVQYAAPGLLFFGAAGPIPGGFPIPPATFDGIAIGDLDGINNQSDSWAFFIQNDYHFSKRFSVTAGARYTHEHLVQDFTAWNFSTDSSGMGTFKCASGDPLPNPSDPFSCYSLPFYNGYRVDPVTHAQIPVHNLFTNANSDGTTYLLSFNFQATNDLLFYLKTARGFRGAAFGRNPQPPAKPEIDVDYEFGMKGDFFEHRLRIDLALYQTNYSNKQEQSATCTQLPFGTPPPVGGCTGAPGVGTNTTVIENAATARIRGVELQAEARPIDGLSTFMTATYTDAHYLSFPNAAPENSAKYGATADLSGYTITSSNPSGAPLWKFDIGARYERAIGSGVLGLQGDFAYRTSLPITPLNEDPITPIAVQKFEDRAIGVLNMRLDYEIASYGLNVALWATNLNNAAYGYEGLNSIYVNNTGVVNTAPPRTFGFTVRKTFGSE